MMRRVNPRSIRVRLTLWYVVVLAAILALFTGGVYLALRDSLHDSLATSIEDRSDALLGVVIVDAGGPVLPEGVIAAAVEEDDDDDELAEFDDERFARTYDTTGAVVSDAGGAAAGVPVDDDSVAAALAGDERWTTVTGEEETYRVLTQPVVRDGQVAGALEVGQADEEVNEALGALLAIVALAAPITLLLATLGGLFLAARALAPIDNITRLARRITAEDLSQRLDLALPDDELGRLARTFDEMIARLDAAFRRQRQFTADASHELRTPLTALKGQVDVALARPRGPEEYRAVLEGVNEEVDRLIRLVGSLLTLARADAGEIPITRERVTLADAVDGAIEQVAPLAAERQVALSRDGDARVAVSADESLLLQLLLNLLDNAIKYTPPGGTVAVRWEADAARATLLVTDSGIGIPPEHLPHLFERFYRVDTARSRAEGGTGLGLAISRWIAEAHGGNIAVASEPGRGTTVTVDLPLAGAAR
jgi:heavy metal sensor kinase